MEILWIYVLACVIQFVQLYIPDTSQSIYNRSKQNVLCSITNNTLNCLDFKRAICSKECDWHIGCLEIRLLLA